ncbi:MAG: type I 3-dehydroquinate dehydratase [Dehalococcoidales bacterium]|nr:type I 3-dehydroquinate dehydratase [Dehalococcoidales bacterium]
MAGNPPRICAAVVNTDIGALESVEPLVDLFEVRIDLIGKRWREVAARLKKPWIACNRRAEEGGKWDGGEAARIKELRRAVELGADIIDIELATPDVAKIVDEIKGIAECMVSYHDIKGTPPLDRLRQIVINELAAGAGICKIATTARKFSDNLTVLQLIAEFSETNIISFAMGEVGQLSRVLCPLIGGYLTYASVGEGRESASGQVTATELREIYRMLNG